ncbi:single-stranded-DNA-specific exonuclease RecJ [Aceticella autotrophica]|uniref:Single-stranded-DNA-specific exonuclease RecJ n=1 Tax=Aceticella autotrophica TaxID=2755338 RepID=A0A975G9D2_9THEO|nr:single-stranded-DNA-specific exonuclease RecJ [Aceticella autotrophica]QSZ26723.1 single-stranded-DNA-specific exonuclease RecJ [Aceticella autotrophica]
MIYRWIENKCDNERLIEVIKKEFNIKGYIAKTLINRGYEDLKDIKKFLYPDINELYDPNLLDGITKAVSIIKEHIKKNNKITIYGDYDVDGITAISVLYKTLKLLNADVDYYIPERLQEGYGINLSAIDKIFTNGTKLIITVDCGISSIKEVERAKSYGMDIIITDHHEVPEVMPEATVVLNPHIKNSTYPFKDLAGVGVSFKLCAALIGKEAYKFLDIVCLGTVADIVPLKGENRIIVKEGLKALNNTNNIGLKALIKTAKLENTQIDTYHVGFIIAPRLNAAGRLKSAVSCVKLLTTEDEKEAEDLSQYLDNENVLRQQIEKEILDEAVKLVEEGIDLNREKVILLQNENWHPGVIGIVSSRITEKYSRPSIIISVKDGIGKGSGRSIKGFNLYEALKACSIYLEKYGGHEMAAGITINMCKFDEFKEKINKYADEKLSDVDLVPTINIDTEIKNEDIDIDAVKQINLLSPFGNGNPNPVYEIKDMIISRISYVGNNNHLKITAVKKGFIYEIIGFGMGNGENKFKEGQHINVVGNLQINTWNNIENIQINAKDIRVKPEYIGFYKNLFNTLRNYKYVSCRLHVSDNIIDMREHKNKNDYILKLFKSDENTVIVINTVKQLKDLIKYFKKDNFYDYKLITESKIYKRGILWGISEEYDLKNYKNIVFYDIPFNAKMFYNIIRRYSRTNKIHLLYGKNDISSNILDLKEIIPQRGDFAKIYNFIKKDNTILFKDQLYNQIFLNPVKLIFCLNVMKKLGLIEVQENDNIFVLTKKRINKKVNIEKDENIRQIYMAKDEFIKFVRLILGY